MREAPSQLVESLERRWSVMTMVRWDPYIEMTSLRQAMDMPFEDTLMWPARSQYDMAGGNLPMDICQTKDDVVVKAALPGTKTN
jgi:HSP20 family molecular chaperone IbpA